MMSLEFQKSFARNQQMLQAQLAMRAASHQQWVAMYQQMCKQAASGVQAQSGQTTPAAVGQQAAQLQRMHSYPYYGAWQQAGQAPAMPSAPQPTTQLARAHSAPTPAATQPAVPVVVPQAAPAVPQPAVQAPAQPQVQAPAPILPNVGAAQPARGIANLMQPAVAFRLFMFYYLFCSPSLPEWQRTAFIGALVLFYLYTVDFVGYLFPTWRQRRNNAAPNADLDIIPAGPNDDENDQPNPARQRRPLSKRELVERFVVGLIASLLPSWNPVFN